MKIEIKHRFTGEILFSIEASSWKVAVEAVIKSGADLRWADLRWANLRGADLRGADLDFSCWPLWCGSLDVKLNKKQKRQLLYHLLAVAPEYRTQELIDEANKFHRVGEVPKLSI